MTMSYQNIPNHTKPVIPNRTKAVLSLIPNHTKPVLSKFVYFSGWSGRTDTVIIDLTQSSRAELGLSLSLAISKIEKKLHIKEMLSSFVEILKNCERSDPYHYLFIMYKTPHWYTI